MPDDKQLTAEEIWAEELKGDNDSTIHLGNAHGEPPPDNGTFGKQPEDNGAQGLIDGNPAPKAAPPAADPPAQKTVEEQLEEMRAAMAATAQREETLRNELKELREARSAEATASAAAAATATAGKDNSPSAKQIKEAAKDPEKWNALKEVYPEWVEGFEERIGILKEELKGAVDLDAERARTTEAIKKANLDLQATLSLQMEERFVERVHKGWKATLKTKEFQEWYGKQDADVRRLGASSAAEDAIELLDKYKAGGQGQDPSPTTTVSSRELRETNRDRLQRAATAPAGQRGGKAAGAKAVDDMTDEEFWNYLDQQDKAKS